MAGTVFYDLQSIFPDADDEVLLDISRAVASGTLSRLDAIDQLREMEVIEEVQKGHDEANESTVECVIYVTHIGGIRKVRDDCRRLKYLMDALKIRYNEVDIAENKWLRSKLQRDSGQDTLPLVFVGERFLGTYDNLAEWNDDGVLMQKLKELGYT
eukprot:EG_transcript_28769